MQALPELPERVQNKAAEGGFDSCALLCFPELS